MSSVPPQLPPAPSPTPNGGSSASNGNSSASNASTTGQEFAAVLNDVTKSPAETTPPANNAEQNQDKTKNTAEEVNEQSSHQASTDNVKDNQVVKHDDQTDSTDKSVDKEQLLQGKVLIPEHNTITTHKTSGQLPATPINQNVTAADAAQKTAQSSTPTTVKESKTEQLVQSEHTGLKTKEAKTNQATPATPSVQTGQVQATTNHAKKPEQSKVDGQPQLQTPTDVKVDNKAKETDSSTKASKTHQSSQTSENAASVRAQSQSTTNRASETPTGETNNLQQQLSTLQVNNVPNQQNNQNQIQISAQQPTPTSSSANLGTTPVFRQVIDIIQPLRGNGDGNYSVSLQLHPAELGTVNVTVSINNGQINMQMSADNQNARDLLQDSLEQLRQELTDSGLTTGTLDVSTGDLSHSENQKFNTQSGEVSQGNAEYTLDDESFFARLGAVTPQDATITDGALDVRI